MKKMVGYGVSIAGLLIMAIGLKVIPIKIAFFDGVAANYIAVAGIIMIIVGVVLSMNKGGGRKKHKSGKSEVPIFEGTGKDRKVVGYRRD